MLRSTLLCAIVVIAAGPNALAEPFTYQGELRQGGEPVTGPVDLTFSLFGVEVGGTPLGDILVSSGLLLDEGRFTVDLDFGDGLFDGSARWIEIAVTIDEETTTLAPRQPILPAPYALHAFSAPDGGGNTGGWQLVGATTSFGGNVGVGTPALPPWRLAVQAQVDPTAFLATSVSSIGTISSLSNPTSDANWQTIATGISHPAGPRSLLFHDAEANVTRLTIDADGNVGIGTTDPNHPLNFANTLGQKIALWGNGATNYGLGIQAGLLQIHTAVNSADVAFGFGGSNTFTETMRIRGTGNVGIGTSAPATSLDIRRPVVDGKGQLALIDPANPATSSAAMAGVSGFGNDIGSAATGRLWYLGSLASTNRDASLLNSTSNGRLTFGTAGRTDDMVIDSTGRVGIGTIAPLGRFNVVGGAGDTARFENSFVNGTLLRLTNTSTGGRQWGLRSSGSGNPEGAGRFVVADMSAASPQQRFSVTSDNRAGEAAVYGSTGAVIATIGARPGGPHLGQIAVRNQSGDAVSLMAVNEDGTGFIVTDSLGADIVSADSVQAQAVNTGGVTCDVLTINGGADIAEPFNVNERSVMIEPGMVVSIDPDRVGELRLSSKAYDHAVAGIVSGAGGVNPGLMLRQHDTVADGEHAVALAGRVYCYVDADAAGPISPGDLLTTSNTRGHAMKATDPARAQGAILGKAMSSLESGRGLVLVLVSLQ